ncbi:MAG: phosphoribosylformylglycinamidine cyclo-ligase [candidate division WOR-3 bacterium]
MLDYRAAGVDIAATGAIKRRIAKLVRSTFSPRVLSEIGLFGALYELRGYRQPVLVASCDGVGTKLMVARMMNRHDTIGEDLVNHSVNDILTLGARPLFFLDYIAYAALPSSVVPEIIRGLVRGCRRNGCALIGGETAMMPGLYPEGDYDLAGTIVGAVERQDIISPRRICAGDLVLGLPSTGLHTNGYSLARRVLFERMGLRVTDPFPGTAPHSRTTVGSVLLRVHRSYLPDLRPYLKQVHALAHITGGGFPENIERLLPRTLDCVLDTAAWSVPLVFRVIQQGGGISASEMYRVFNMGIGMVIVASPSLTRRILREHQRARLIGRIVPGRGRVVLD